MNTKTEVWLFHKTNKYKTEEIMSVIYDTLMGNTNNPQFIEEYKISYVMVEDNLIEFIIRGKTYRLTLKKVAK